MEVSLKMEVAQIIQVIGPWQLSIETHGDMGIIHDLRTPISGS